VTPHLHALARTWSHAVSFAAFAVLAALAALLPACAEPERGIVVWHAYRGGEQKALEQVASRWSGRTGTKVTLLAVPYDAYAAKLEAAIPRGNGPDVFVSPHERLGSYVQNGLVAPVGDALPPSEEDAYERAALAAVRWKDAVWAVPLATKCVALYRNTSLVPEAPETLEALVAPRTAWPAGVVPLAYEAQSPYYHAALLHAYGGSLFDGAGFAMTGPAAERAAARLKELQDTGAIARDASGDDVKRLFLAGKAAAVVSGPWLAGDLGERVPYAVTALPAVVGAGKMKPYLTVDGAFVTPAGAKKSDARAFARELGGDESARTRATAGAQVVARRAFWADPAAGTPLLRAFHTAAEDAIPMPFSVEMRATWVPAQQALLKVLRGDASPHDALDEARARYADVMKPQAGSASKGPYLAVVGLLLLGLALFAVRRASRPGFQAAFRAELRASLPAYKYVAHAALTVLVLVVLPLVAGAATSFFAGTKGAPTFVGLDNYVQILTARGKPLLSHGSFYLTLLVTVVWTVVNVFFHVSLGLVLGILLARPFLKLRAVYRVLLVLPWAVPSYVTALAWKGMFHRQFGAVNAILGLLGVPPVSWFSKFSTAFAANVATNVWLGFPFMMVVVMGALTSIPKDVLEAAEVDGATRWQAFTRVTLPLLRPTLLPAVVLGSVWTFNMFNVVFLVSGGEPDGTTDILVSEAYRWAFARNAQIGYAAAYAVIIFGLLALMSRVLGRIGGGAPEGDAT
jgi:arabinogalactan oligomer/maltooligosaccharide transport system permease protein